MKEWVVSLPGKQVAWKHGPTGTFPTTDPGTAKSQVSELLLHLKRPAVLTAVRSMHRALTGQRLEGAFSPFESSSLREARLLERSLISGLTAGRMKASALVTPAVAIPLPPEAFEPVGGLGPSTAEETSVFEVCLLDVGGTALSGVDVTFSSQGKQEKKKTGSDGVARFEGFEGSFGSLTIDPKSLADVAEPLWEKGIKPVNFKGKVDQVILSSEIEPFALENELRRTIVFRPEPGILSVELRDKTGQVAYAGCEYEVSGPESFEGVTDELGRLRHEEVPPGDYEVSVKVNYIEDLKLEAKTFKTRAVVLDAGDGQPQIRLIGAVPFVRMARLRGLLFDLNKTFLLPTALEGLEGFRELSDSLGPAHLLIVGHTDTSGEPSINDPLSQKRAESVQQYLERNVDAWLENYSGSGAGVWGNREDRLMVVGICDAETRKRQAAGAENPELSPGDEDVISFYQRFHNAKVDEGLRPDREKLEEDGIAGDKTRKELITDYMAIGGLGWTAIKDLPLTIECHGCGENFPLDGTGLELDARAVAERDGERDRVDRRVELFFFDSTFKVAPAITGPSGEEYLTWRKLAREDRDVVVEGVRQKALKLPLTDAHFRTGSAVMLPEGTAPAGDASAPLTSVGALAVALRFNADRPGHRLLVAGHTDSVGSDASNDKLSAQRGELVHAVLMGGSAGRDKFVDLAMETGTVSDWKQVLKWSAAAFPSVDPLAPSDSEEPPPEASGEDGELGTGFGDADPGVVDDNAASAAPAVKAFQQAYSDNFKLLGGSAAIAVDGEVGKETWGAIYDLYQYNIAQELGEDLDGANKLRELITFLPGVDPFIGFGESAPVDGIAADNVESQVNRRVEVLFFAKGQEPDLAVLKEDPKLSELHLPEVFEREDIGGDSAKPGAFEAKPFFVRVLRVPEAEDREDELELRSADGKFKLRRSVKKPAAQAEDLLDLSFGIIPTKHTYSLEVFPKEGDAYVVFSGVSYDDLHGLGSAEADLADADPLEVEPPDGDA